MEKNLTVRIDKQMLDDLKALAKSKGQTVSGFLRLMISDELAKAKKEK